MAQRILWCLLAGRLLSPSLVEAAERRLDGAEIFRKQCATCHGRNGEGVQGKFDEPLQGDRSLESLIRYIDRAMPEDDPDKCIGKEAEAVGRYIYNAFYSREARLRKNPPRVELVRLTNRQYVNSVADLIKHFTGKDGAPGEERGLQATYYNRSDFNAKNKAFDRVDRTIDFDFGEGNPDDEHFPTNAFAIQWRGSVIAEESGDYEFVLKTPNGVRLWINDDETPLIDAWVASGQVNEHRATVKLIGGRLYPLRLNFFKYKDKTASVSLQWKPPHGALQTIPARSLCTTRSSPTFVVTTPFPADDSSVGYERGVSISKAWDEATTHAAIETATYVAANLNRLSRSQPDHTNRQEKIIAFCEEFAAVAFRRPLTTEQKRIFVSNQLKEAANTEDAVKRVVMLTLMSPRFLYLGLNDETPDDFEVATRLAYAMWDSLPDRELIKLARDAKLHTREQVSQQARRMLNDPRTRAKVQSFLHHWLQVDRVTDLAKDEKIFPDFTPEIIADLRTSLNLFLEDAFWNGSSDFRNLLLEEKIFVNNRLAEFYGAKADATDDFVKVKLGGEQQRSGVLTHPYLLAAFSYQKLTSPIHRGVFLTRNIVGRALRSPPMAMTFKDAEFDPNLTMREKVAELTRPQACQSCHAVINPLGFSLEHFDAVGRFRSTENDRPINAVSDYTTDDGQTIRLTGARDVAKFAAESEQAQNGFIEQLFHQLVKQPMLAYGPDVMPRLREGFVASGFNMQKLLMEIAIISAMHDLDTPQQRRKT